MTMTPQQAAEVLRKRLQNLRFFSSPKAKEQAAAIETAIECIINTPCQHCEDPKGFELGQVCKHCQQPFRSALPATPTPTDEQIGEVFDEYADFPLFQHPSMTRTAAIRFAKALFGQFKSER